MEQYSRIIVDASNIFYRLAVGIVKDNNNEADIPMFVGRISTKMIDFIKSLQINTLGDVCVLFDPLPNIASDKPTRLTRKVEDENYKANRDKTGFFPQLRVRCLEEVYLAFIQKELNGGQIKVYYDSQFEADDYVEQLVCKNKGKTLMFTKDGDFARYLSNGADMHIRGLKVTGDAIYTAADYIKDKRHPFNPTIASVTIWKVLFGDESDNITGVFNDKRTKVYKDTAGLFMEAIKQLGEDPSYSLDRAISNLYNGSGVFEKPIVELKKSMTEKSYQTVLDLISSNVNLVSSRIPIDGEDDVEHYSRNLTLSLFSDNADALKKKSGKFKFNTKR